MSKKDPFDKDEKLYREEAPQRPERPKRPEPKKKISPYIPANEQIDLFPKKKVSPWIPLRDQPHVQRQRSPWESKEPPKPKKIPREKLWLKHMHETIGNKGVEELLTTNMLFQRMALSNYNDKQEREADKVSEKVLQRKLTPEEEQTVKDQLEVKRKEDDDRFKAFTKRRIEELHRQFHGPKEKETQPVICRTEAENKMVSELDFFVQRKLNLKDKLRVMDGKGILVGQELENEIRSIKGGGSPMKKEERKFYESRFNRDFGNVRIHTGEKADKLAKSVNARAFTYGNDIVFGKGEYSQGTTKGKKLMAHELTHVVQQGQARIQRRVIQRQKRDVPELLSEKDLEKAKEWMKKNLPDVVVEKIASTVGLLGGVGSSLNELAEMVRSTLDVFVRGALLKEAENFLEEFKNMSFDDLVEAAKLLGEDFVAKVTSEDPWVRGYSQGYIVGYLAGEVLLAYVSYGSLTGLKGPMWTTKLGQKIKNLKSFKAIPKMSKKVKRTIKKTNLEVDKLIKSADYIAKRDKAFISYLKRGGTKSKKAWEAMYDTLTRNRAIGKVTEDTFQAIMKGSPKSFKVNVGGKWYSRNVDNFYGNTCRELKSGPLKLDDFIKMQIKKDMELINTYGYKIEWHLFAGGDQKAIAALNKAKFKVYQY